MGSRMLRAFFEICFNLSFPKVLNPIPKVNYHTLVDHLAWIQRTWHTCKMPHFRILLRPTQNLSSRHPMEVLNRVIVESGFLSIHCLLLFLASSTWTGKITSGQMEQIWSPSRSRRPHCGTQQCRSHGEICCSRRLCPRSGRALLLCHSHAHNTEINFWTPALTGVFIVSFLQYRKPCLFSSKSPLWWLVVCSTFILISALYLFMRALLILLETTNTLRPG